MTGLAILTFIPLLVALGFMIRMRAEQKARRAAERTLEQLLQRQHGVGSQEWFAVLAHELRSPVAAILGYDELLEDGTFGELSPAALDATRRIRTAARNLVSLIEGLEQSAGARDEELPDSVQASELIDAAMNALSLDAEGRGTTLHAAGADVALRTRRHAAERALVLMLGAAVKASPGATLNIEVVGSDRPAVAVRGTRIDPQHDGMQPDQPLTGPAFRLQLARAAAAAAGGSIDVDGDGSVRLNLPRL